MRKCQLDITEELLHALIANQHTKETTFARLIEEMKRTDNEGYRVCMCCEKLIIEGYVIGEWDIYCSDKCLTSKLSIDEYNALYDSGDAYWTAW